MNTDNVHTSASVASATPHTEIAEITLIALCDFLENKYKPHSGIDLVVVVAMPYGEIVEDKYKYEVISTARNDVKQLASKFKNANFGIISHGSY